MKRLVTILASLALCGAVEAEERNSFAIVVDNASYQHCAGSIEAYKEAVRDGGLDAFISAQDWACPEQVKDSLKNWYADRKLEGAVFVGDIPIPMVRQGQFLTSAFKMDEKGFAWRDNSVPSDRFYDDFDLSFEFIKRDSVETSFFYYNLVDGQREAIECDIYTARIKPSSAWEDKYTELDNYFRKLVAVKAEQNNTLDHITSYTGEGSFSNSMVAWIDETKTLSEKAPDAFKTLDGARFFNFHQAPVMKEMLLKAACEEDSDLYLFHCHGTPERQWIGGYISADEFQSNEPAESYSQMYEQLYQAEVDLLKYQLRSQYRRYIHHGYTEDEIQKRMADRFDIDASWYEGALDPEVAKKDSLLEEKTVIALADVQRYNTNSRVVLFDACYNGDFREDDNIATRYIMGHGKTVVGLGNSVNVLQDKDSSPLMGMLSCGYSVGQWQQQVNILESHIIGDPTFRFATSYPGIQLPDLKNSDPAYWKSILNSNVPSDLKALALTKIVNLSDPQAAKILRDTYCSSDSYTLRLEAMLLLRHYDSPYLKEVLVKSLDDPYEFIRRKGAHYLTMLGDDSTIDALTDAYMRDYNAKRVAFNILNGAGMFAGSAFVDNLNSKIDAADFLFDKDSFRKKSADVVAMRQGLGESFEEAITDTTMKPGRRSLYCNMMRNEPYPYLADKLVDLVLNDAESTKLRVECAEILGWFTSAHNRADIISRLEKASISDEAVAKEARKTVSRLKEYTK